MADDNAQASRQAPEPNPALKNLDVMVGTWNVTGPEITGQATFERLEGGFYLVQRSDFDRLGRRIAGVEYVGYDEDKGAPKSYVFSNGGPFGPSGGAAPEYAWEVGGGTVTIWLGDVGSPARISEEFSRRRQHRRGRLGEAGRRVRGDPRGPRPGRSSLRQDLRGPRWPLFHREPERARGLVERWLAPGGAVFVFFDPPSERAPLRGSTGSPLRVSAGENLVNGSDESV